MQFFLIFLMPCLSLPNVNVGWSWLLTFQVSTRRRFCSISFPQPLITILKKSSIYISLPFYLRIWVAPLLYYIIIVILQLVISLHYHHACGQGLIYIYTHIYGQNRMWQFGFSGLCIASPFFKQVI